MMKTTLLLILITFSTFARDDSIRPFRFIEAKNIKQLSALPPKIELTFEIMCNEEFIKVVRHDWLDPDSKKTSIAVGGLIRMNHLSSCAGVKKEIKEDAGPAFSGREYEISRIKLR